MWRSSLKQQVVLNIIFCNKLFFFCWKLYSCVTSIIILSCAVLLLSFYKVCSFVVHMDRFRLMYIHTFLVRSFLYESNNVFLYTNNSHWQISNEIYLWRYVTNRRIICVWLLHTGEGRIIFFFSVLKTNQHYLKIFLYYEKSLKKKTNLRHNAEKKDFHQ